MFGSGTTCNFESATCGESPVNEERSVKEEARKLIKDLTPAEGRLCLLLSGCAGLTTIKITSKVLASLIGRKAGLIANVGCVTISVLAGGYAMAKTNMELVKWINISRRINNG